MRLSIGLLCHRGVGGSARIAVELGNTLAARGHRVHMFARTLPLGIRAFGPGVTFHPLREGDGFAPASPELDANWSPGDMHTLADRVVSVARSAGIEVLHFHYAVPFAWVAREARRRLGSSAPPLVGTLHGTDVSVHGRSRPNGGLARTLAEIDQLTSVSRSHVRLAMETFGLPRPPELIPNFVDTGRFSPVGARSNADRLPRIVHVSNFRPVKDLPALVRVFAEVRRHLNAELWLVGDGQAMHSVRSIVRKAHLGPHVRFFGLRPAVETILPHADLLLLTSRAESFGLAVLEAAACGVPAVAPRIGGLPEVVAHGATGLLFDPGDESSAAAAVLKILGDAGLHSSMRGRAVHRARGFSTEKMVPRYEQLYQRLLLGRSLRRRALPESAPRLRGRRHVPPPVVESGA